MASKGGLRRALTTLGQKIERYCTTIPIPEQDIRTALSQLNDKRRRLDTADAESLESIQKKHENDPLLEEMIETEFSIAEAYRDNYCRWRSEIEETLAKLTPPVSPEVTPPQAQGDSNLASNSSFKLPEFHLSKFDGNDFLKFPGWMDQFISLIHQNEGLSDIQKFGILKESLSGPPRGLVDGLLNTKENYKKALDLLEETYHDPNLLLGVFVSRLHSLKAVGENKIIELQQLVIKFEQSFHEITTLIKKLHPEMGPDNSHDYTLVSYFLTPHLMSKLPETVQLRWMEKFTEPQMRYDFVKLQQFLKQDLQSKQACKLLNQNSVSERYQPKNNFSRRPPTRFTRESNHSAAQSFVTYGSQPCVCCQENHHLKNCPNYAKKSLVNRCTFVSETIGLCSNCLYPSHEVHNCFSRVRCTYCGSKHHQSLCKKAQPPPTQCVNPEEAGYFPPPQATSLSQDSRSLYKRASESQSSENLLQVIKINLSNPADQFETQTFLLFDSGSSHSWIRKDISDTLRLPTLRSTEFALQTFGGIEKKVESDQVECYLASLAQPGFRYKFTPFTSETLTGELNQSLSTPVPPHLQHLDLVPCSVLQEGHIEPGIIIGTDWYWSFMEPQVILGNPTACKTKFGWTLMGRTSKEVSHTKTSTSFFQSIKKIENHFELESLGITDRPMESLEYSDPEFKDGRYEVKLPFKNDLRPQNNFNQAKMRLNRLRIRMKTEEINIYDKKIEEYLEKKFIVETPPQEKDEGYYLPHHIVYKGIKPRIVFDASCKTRNNLSLNDTLDAGPNLLNQLYDVMLRFRQGYYTSTHDVEAAFLQLSVNLEQRKYLKFLWQEKTFSFLRLPFGVAASPYLLNSTVQYFISKEKNKDLREKLLNSSYVDDTLSSFSTLKEKQVYDKLAPEVFQKAGMNLKVTTGPKILGLLWDRTEDFLSIDISRISTPETYTKRNLLKSLASFYDPLGLASPFQLNLKVLFRETWIQNFKWDDLLSEELTKKWQDWLSQKDGEMIKIPRWSGQTQGKPWVLHLFADASAVSFSCVAYCHSQGHLPVLLTSKTKVCPIKAKLTIPRKELLGVLIATRLANRIHQEYGRPQETFIWSDSQTVLYWIQSGRAPKNETFVYNRVLEITQTQKELIPLEFRYIKGEENIADLATRGCTLSELANNSVWSHGPPFLVQDRDTWEPPFPTPSTVFLIKAQENDIKPILKIDDFSSLQRLLSTTAWLRRYVQYLVFLKRGPNGHPPPTGKITNEELDRELFFWIKQEQRNFFTHETELFMDEKKINSTSALFKLHPQWSQEKEIIILQARTRSQPYILLPRRSWLTHLVIDQVHQRSLHAGPQATLSELRTDYWIPHGLSEVKKTLYKCRPCRRFRTTSFKTPESQMMPFRTEDHAPFFQMGVDYFGPIYTSNGDKNYVFLFVCASTRAVHLELCRDGTTEEAHLHFRKFLALRTPMWHRINCYSDNAKVFKKLSTMKFPFHTVNWKFSPSFAPSVNGWIERLVSVCKRSIRVSFRHASLSHEDLQAVLYEVTACVNKRPLTCNSTSMNDLSPITPSHFLHGTPNQRLMDHYLVGDPNLRKRLLSRNKFGEFIWNVWKKQYLTSLRGWHASSLHTTPTPTVGEIVLVRQPANRGQWPLGKILKLFVGRDGHVRVAEIMLNKTRTIRKLSHLYPLEIPDVNSEIPNSQDTNVIKIQPELQNSEIILNPSPPVEEENDAPLLTAHAQPEIQPRRSSRATQRPDRFRAR